MEDEEQKISKMDAYKAMFLFLNRYWKLGNKESDEVAGLLGGLSLLPDGASADPALLDDWKKAVEEVVAKNNGKPWNLKLDK